MLVSLSIRDVVLISHLALDFAPGYCALTGETGAGKSILLDALALVLGERGDAGLVRAGASQASVSAEFSLELNHPVFALLEDQGLVCDGPLVLRRTLGADGRSRAFVCDQPVGVGVLKKIGALLVEIHGQFESQGLLDSSTHRALLDSHGRLDGDVQKTGAAWRTFRQMAEAREAAAAEAARARTEEDFLRHSVRELDTLSPEIGEEEKLASRRTFLMHREKLLEALAAAEADLSASAEGAISSALRALSRVAGQAAGHLDGVLETLERASAELEETLREIRSLAGESDMDSQSLEAAEERLFALRDVARKHGVEVDALPALREDLARRLSLLEDGEDTLAKLARQEQAARDTYEKAAAALTKARTKAAASLDKAVAVELEPLKLGRAVFKTQVEVLPADQWGPQGADRVVFTASTNPGSAPGPISKIASGGELARFMLALKVVLADAGAATTLVFDEVDTGIGGSTADAVGQRLARLGEKFQVLVVTHSPQVTARAARHFHVAKQETKGAMETVVSPLAGEARVEEIARMISGSTVTDEARAQAQRLLKEAA